jgi:hypothetical protein
MEYGECAISTLLDLLVAQMRITTTTLQIPHCNLEKNYGSVILTDNAEMEHLRN